KGPMWTSRETWQSRLPSNNHADLLKPFQTLYRPLTIGGYAGEVTGNHSNLPKLPLRLSPLQILGLRDPDEGDWGRLRALQYAQLHKASLTRIMAHALAALLTVSIFGDKAPFWLLCAWLTALALAVGNATRIDRSLAAEERSS